MAEALATPEHWPQTPEQNLAEISETLHTVTEPSPIPPYGGLSRAPPPL